MKSDTRFYRLIITGLLLCLTCGQNILAQEKKNIGKLQLLGTRSWIRVNWPAMDKAKEYRLYWSAGKEKPLQPNITSGNEKNHFYIQHVKPETAYHVWLEAVYGTGRIVGFEGEVTTVKNWVLDSPELEAARTNPGSAAVPKGMQLFWHDEFNDELLNRNKWSTNYYSSIDYLYGNNFSKMKADSLPQPAYILNGKTINLFTSDSLPAEVYDVKNNKKISSIQTYDWGKNENLLDNSRGGYFEVKVKRSSTGKPGGLNTAFWFDSPGPDLKYYLEKGTVLNGVQGIRPKGQVFEIDVFEYLNAQFVLHGDVDKAGKFRHNLATHIAEGYNHINNWVVHGMLWTPTSISHYINGNLIKEYSNKHQIYAPDHFMNVLLGSYGGGETVNMEVDYIRGYQWPLNNGNELPNPGFEDSGSLLPWEGNGSLVKDSEKNRNMTVLLKPGQMIEQYVYLNNDTDYKVEYWMKGAGATTLTIDDVKQVSGELSTVIARDERGSNDFRKKSARFRSGNAYGNNMKTVRICFANTGPADVFLDDITIKK